MAATQPTPTEPTTSQRHTEDGRNADSASSPVEPATTVSAETASPATAPPATASRQIANAALIVMIFFVLSRVTGLAREVVIGARFGTSAEYDAYLAAFRVPDILFQLIAGGALGSAFIPVFSGYWVRQDRAGAWLLFSRVLNIVTLLLLGLAAIAAVAAPWLVQNVIATGFTAEQQALTTLLMRWMLVGTVIFGASGLIMGALNATQHFLWPAAAPIFYNLAILGSALWLAPRWGIQALVVGVVAGSVLHLLAQLPQLLRTGVKYTPSVSVADAGVREVLRLMGPRVLGLLFVQMHFLVNTILASHLVAGSISALNYAWLLMLLPLGIFSQSVATAAFPTFAAQIAAGDLPAMRSTFSQTLRTVFFLVIPAGVVLIVYGAPLVRILLERGEFTAASTRMVAFALAFYGVGLVGHAALEIIVRAFYALHNTWTPVLVGVAAMALNIVLGIWWVNYWQHGGLALANSVATSIEALLLFVLLRRLMRGVEGRRLLDSMARSLLAALAMGVLLWYLARWLPLDGGQGWLPTLLWTLVGLALGIAAYLGVAALLRHPDLAQVGSLIARRLRRGRT